MQRIGIAAVAAATLLAGQCFGLELQPIAVAETEVRAVAHEFEGLSGFTVPRAYLGGRVALHADAELVLVGNWRLPEAPDLLDVALRFRPHSSVEVIAGYWRTPAFSSVRDQFDERQPVPERSLVAGALGSGRDLGVDVHLRSADLPVAAWLHVGNGVASVVGNDNTSLAVDARADWTLGRARHGAQGTEPVGLLVGVSGHFDPNSADRAAIAGRTVTGFAWWRGPTVSGRRWLVQGHALAQWRSVQVRAEAGFASEGRSQDSDGNPSTPRAVEQAVHAWGWSGEAAWMVLGPWRHGDAWPGSESGAQSSTSASGGLEVAGRAERLAVGRAAQDVTASGAYAVSAAVRWWSAAHWGLALAGYRYAWDTAPVEARDVRETWTVLARLTVSVR